MTSDRIKAIIRDHQMTSAKSYERYQRYYEGNNVTIQDKYPQPEPDNRNILAYGRIAVNRFTGYMFPPGNIVFEYKGNNKTIAELNGNDGQLKITNCATNTLTKGLGYIIVWQQKDGPELGKVKWAVLPAENVIIEWSQDIDPVMLAAYYFYDNEIINDEGNKEKYTTFWKYSAAEIDKWISKDNEKFIQEEGYPVANPAKRVNIAEFYINPEKRNLFYHVINLMDLLDEIVSTNMANEIQTIADAILMIFGKYLDDEMADPLTGETERSKFLLSKIKILDGLNKEAGDMAQWLTKAVQWEGIFGIFDRIRSAIYEMLEMPDLQDPQFQSAESGKALMLKTWAFENKASMIEANFKPGLIDLVEIMNAFPASDKVDIDKMKITFKRNFPQDKAETIKEAVDIAAMFGAETAAEYLGEDLLPKYKEVLKRIQNQLADDITNILTADVKDEPQIPEEGAAEIEKDVVLNGAQIQAALKIIEAAVTGLITRETAISQIEIFFNIGRDKAIKIVGQLSKGKLKDEPQAEEEE